MKIMSTAQQAIIRQTEKLAASAERVARVGDTEGSGKDVDLAAEAVVRIEATAATKANLAVIKNEDERLGALLDILS